MANFSVSPGVTTNEIDNTFLTGQPTQAGAAIIGPTVKGPVEIPTLVTSYSDYVNRFGDILISGSDTYSYLTSISAYNYFQNGGKSLIVARVTSGSYTPSITDVVTSGSYIVNGYVENTYIANDIVFTLETISEGIIMNNSGSVNPDGTLEEGTKDNVRIEITSPNTSSGAFNVVVRRGDDKANDKIILESWNNVNLDPNSTRFISKIIGDQIVEYNPTSNQIEITSGNYSNKSRYIRVKEVAKTTPNYLDNSGNPVSAYTASIPAIQNTAFFSGSGDIAAGANFYQNIGVQTQGVTAGDYTDMVNLLSNKDDYQFNILSTPGLINEHHTSIISQIVSNTINRGDNLYVVDMVDYDGVLADVVTQAATRNTSYSSTYWPWVRINDPATGKQVHIPASTLIPGVYAYNDKVAAPWFAPAGINRGGLLMVLAAKSKLSQANRDTLYEANINPIATFPKTGVSVYGQKTLQKGASALDRINVRRLLIELKSRISQIANTLVFEQNTITTRNNFLSQVNPYLEAIQQKQGLYAFRVVMDESINTPDVIDRNQLVGQIYIQPSRTAEFINLDFILQPTGAEFPG
jgi:phage tail sheath protein FI